MIGCRDPLGVRPLVLGDLDGAYILASETCALDIIGARLRARHRARRNGRHHRARRAFEKPFPLELRRASASSNMSISPGPIPSIEGTQRLRGAQAIGAELARESPADADMVVPVPDSGTPAAIGFAQGAGLPFELGIIRNHYVGRTFIQPTRCDPPHGREAEAQRQPQDARRQARGAGRRFHRARHHSQKIVQMVRDAGAREVHMRIASPPTMSSCFYGVDTPETAEAARARACRSRRWREFIRVDSLGFLSIDGLYRAVGEAARNNEHAAILRCLLHRPISRPG